MIIIETWIKNWQMSVRCINFVLINHDNDVDTSLSDTLYTYVGKTFDLENATVYVRRGIRLHRVTAS